VNDHDEQHSHDTGRLEAFSDGVFAIAITLLIIEVSVPHVEEGGDLGQALRDQWPSYFGYVVSFIFIGVTWINHREVFHDIAETDHTVNVLNMFLLLCIAFVPFPTAVLAEYLQDEDQLRPAVQALGATFLVAAIFYNAIWRYASSDRRLLNSWVSDTRIRKRNRNYLLGPVLYGAAIPLAFISPWISLAIIGGLAVLFLIPPPE
jgi:uncharacterized membrane protein